MTGRRRRETLCQEEPSSQWEAFEIVCMSCLPLTSRLLEQKSYEEYACHYQGLAPEAGPELAGLTATASSHVYVNVGVYFSMLFLYSASLLLLSVDATDGWSFFLPPLSARQVRWLPARVVARLARINLSRVAAMKSQ